MCLQRERAATIVLIPPKLMKRPLLLVTATLAIFACNRTAPSDPLDEAVATFLVAHPDLGDLQEIEPLPNWARGERRRVTLSTGRYVMYFFGGRVVTV